MITCSSYNKYLKTYYWNDLKIKYIYSNPHAKCWICEKSFTLLLHHISYDNLYAEKLYRDVFILCFNCHTRVHFLLFNTFRLPLSKTILLIRMRFLRFIFLVQKRRFIAAVFRLITCIIPL